MPAGLRVRSFCAIGIFYVLRTTRCAILFVVYFQSVDITVEKRNMHRFLWNLLSRRKDHSIDSLCA